MSSTLEHAASTARPFGWRDKVGYLLGDFGNDFVFIFASSFLLVFYTNVVGLAPALVGAIMVGVRLIDAFVDVAWGRFLDQHEAAASGRFRTWIARGAVPLAIITALLYMPAIAEWAYPAKVAYVGITYLLWGSFFYMMVNIAYGSMASVMTSDPSQRASLSIWRSTGAALAGLFVGVVPPLIIYTTVDGVSQVVPIRVFLTATAFAVLALILLFACYALTRERVLLPPVREKRSLRQVIRVLARSRALVSLLAANVILMVSQFLVQSITPYLWLNYFNNGALSSVASLLGIVPLLILAPFTMRLARRFGKKELGLVAGALAAVAQLVLFVAHVTNPFVYLGISFVGTFGMGLFTLLVWAYITDVIDDLDAKNGRRDDGTVYAVVVWARKLGLAAVGGISGAVLSGIGFVSGQPTQSPATVQGIYLVVTLVPGVLTAVFTIVLGVLYPLNRARVEANAATLERRRAQPDQGAVVVADA